LPDRIVARAEDGIDNGSLVKSGQRLIPALPVRAAALALLLAAAGCATVPLPQRDHLAAAEAPLRECAHWFRALDAAVDAAAVGDRAARPVAGFPYLRSDRFTAALARPAAADAALFDPWVARMRTLDADARRVEIANLPSQAIERLGVADRAVAGARSEMCAQRLAAVDFADDTARARLVRRAPVADDYSALKRTLGLYALVRLPFWRGIEDWQREATETFRAARDGAPVRNPQARYTPPRGNVYSRPEVAALLERARGNPFGIADLSADERERLFATYAPVLEIETTGDYDRIGALRWGRSPAPEVDLSRPTVYRKLAHTRVGERTLLQLVYVAWTPERPKDGPFDLLGGRLDGIVWRVTLADDGEPVLFDTIHPCGCFHMFFPTPRAEPLPAPAKRIEWAFSPASLPALGDGERVVVSVQTRTHYLRNVSPGDAAEGIEYAFADYDALRTLPLPDGGTRSVFRPDGLVPGTQRAERFLFWPMGIDSAGAMRQWGSHATAFLGRRHFDDADLIDQRFRLR
jgi:hypothetical protein